LGKKIRKNTENFEKYSQKFGKIEKKSEKYSRKLGKIQVGPKKKVVT